MRDGLKSVICPFIQENQRKYSTINRDEIGRWCRRRESNPYALKRAADFKSATSTNFVTPAIPYAYKKRGTSVPPLFKSGAGDESRTRDLNLGKVALYQLSYSRRNSVPGGARRNRTAVNGFAIRCMATLLSRRPSLNGAGDESRTRDLNLGKVALYQLSYSRIEKRDFTDFKKYVKSLELEH